MWERQGAQRAAPAPARAFKATARAAKKEAWGLISRAARSLLKQPQGAESENERWSALFLQNNMSKYYYKDLDIFYEIKSLFYILLCYLA